MTERGLGTQASQGGSLWAETGRREALGGLSGLRSRAHPGVARPQPAQQVPSALGLGVGLSDGAAGTAGWG